MIIFLESYDMTRENSLTSALGTFASDVEHEDVANLFFLRVVFEHRLDDC